MQVTTAYQTLLFEAQEGIATITLANPGKRNPLSLEALGELRAVLERIGPDREFKVVVLRALGSAFSAGHDLREVHRASADGDAEYAARIFAACSDAMDAIQAIPQPVIAEVSGVATAAGCQLVATCDLAFASVEAKFATPGVNIGLFCTTPMVALSRAIGRKRALQMLLTGDFIDASTAAGWGLINGAVSAELLEAEVLAVARKIAQASAYVVGLGKAAFYEQIDLPQRAAYAYAEGVMSANALDADAREGIGAFLERRSPS